MFEPRIVQSLRPSGTSGSPSPAPGSGAKGGRSAAAPLSDGRTAHLARGMWMTPVLGPIAVVERPRAIHHHRRDRPRHRPPARRSTWCTDRCSSTSMASPSWTRAASVRPAAPTALPAPALHVPDRSLLATRRTSPTNRRPLRPAHRERHFMARTATGTDADLRSPAPTMESGTATDP